MGKLVSNIQNLAAEQDLDEREFIGRCYAEGLSLDTAKKLWDGETNVNAQSLAVAAKVLGKTNIGEVILIDGNGSH